MEGFELFDNQSITRVVDKITITKNYMLNFPSAFYKINKINNEKSVLLYYNKNEQKIGIEFQEEVDPRGFRITSSGSSQNGGGYITAKNFFAMNGLIGKIKLGRYNYTTEHKTNQNKDHEEGCAKKIFVIKLEY